MAFSRPCPPLAPVPVAGDCCLRLPADTPIQRPDLAIYSQVEQLARSIPPTWDSPDILTNDWGPFRLRAEAQVIVRNLSGTATAANALVDFSVAPFGIGFVPVLVQTQRLTLGPGGSATLTFPLSQAVLAGDPRAGVFVDLSHPYDTVPVNDHGAQVHEGRFTSESGRSFTQDVPLFNAGANAETWQLALVVDGCTASLAVSAVTLAAGEARTITMHVVVPGGVHGTPASPVPCSATVYARRTDGSLVGGLTRLVRIDD